MASPSRSQVAGRLCDILDALLSAYSLRSSSLSTKRPATEGENSDYSDEDENLTDSSVEVLESSVSRHPRPTAGLKHIIGASTSTAATSSTTTASSSQEPVPMDLGFQPSQFPDFSLPITSAELGSLPVYDFTFDPPAVYPNPNQHFNADMTDAMFGANTQESNYTSRTMAESLSTAFGHLGIYELSSACHGRSQ